jgi:D-alanyl-D-alanine carboxypeptidase
MVKSANDMAVVLAEGVGGSIDDFAQAMTDTAHKLGMSESNFVNPNGLPADGQIMSARDLAILARALIRQFPQYSFYWHVPASKYGRRIVRNYNPLLGRYQGADGMKTGFICASGFNMVATATRDNKQLIAVVLGAPSSAARAVKAAELLEGGFAQKPLAWLTPSLGTVDQLQPIDAPPPNLKDSMCGPHRKRQATEEDDPDAPDDSANGPGANAAPGAGTPQFSVLLSALRAPTAKNLALLPDPGPVVPTVVYTGPTRTQQQVDALAALPEAADPVPKKGKKKVAKGEAKPAAKAAAVTPAAIATAPATAQPNSQAKTGKPTGSNIHYTPSSSSASATSAAATAPKKPKPATPAQ